MLPELQKGSAACGQDIFVADLLGNMRKGVFVDIGANDGVTISNSLYFEKQLDWSGIAIEPIPSVFEKLRKNRTCDVVNGCVTPSPGKATFLEVAGGTNMLSTLAIHNVGLTARRLRNNAKRSNASIVEIEVDCFTLNSLTEKFGISEIDFLSIDTEGGELEILKSIDFDRTPVKVLSVENNFFKNSIREYMEQNGFFYIGTFKIDEIYMFGGKELRTAMQGGYSLDVTHKKAA